MSTEANPAPTPAAPAQTQPAVNRSLTDPPVGSPSPIEPNLTLPVSEYQKLIGLQAQLAQIQTEQRAAIEEREQAKIKALAEKGQVEEAFAKHREMFEAKVRESTEKYNTLENSLLVEKKLAVLSSAFTGREFAGETPEAKSMVAAQLRQILEAQYEAARDASGQIVVREKASLRPAADAVKEALASPLYAHFFAPTSRGGTGSDGSRPHAAQQQPPAPSGSLEDIAAKFREAQTGMSRNFGPFGAIK